MSGADVLVENHGSILLLSPLNARGGAGLEVR
jgi:hypothetical protein